MRYYYRSQLREFEKSLRPLLAEAELIGEIPLSEVGAIEIQSALCRLLEDDGPESATLFLQEESPCTLARFLVWKGTQDYHEGNYWPEVCQPIGLPAHSQRAWGEIFEAITQRFQLADFRDIGGRRFVTPILLHGGIPASCLPDFFDNVIWPSVQGNFGYSDNAHDLIDDFLDSSRAQTTSKPVRRFLEKGGKIATDFVQRCLDLAIQADSVDTSSSGEEFGLPPYVVEQFFAWREERATSQPQTFRRIDLPRYRAPQIFLSINQGGLSFSFPAQRIPRNALSDSRELKLEVQQDGERIEYPLYGTRTGEMIETETHDAALKLREKYHFTLLVGTKTLREWPFSGLSSKQPWLTFHGPSGKLLPGQIITERDIWIVFPTAWTIAPTPSVRVREEAAFTREFQASRLVIEGHPPDIRFTNENGKAIPVPVKWRDTPTLQPASREIWPRLSSEDAEREFTVYCGHPPRLLIPQPIPDRAFLTIRPIGHSYPAERKKIRLKDLSAFSPQDDDPTLALDDPALLGPTPHGRFILQVRGRLGRDTTFRLCLLPEIQFDFPRSALLPTPEPGSQTVSFSLAHPHLEELDIEPPAEQSYDGNGYRVEVPANSRHVALTLYLSAGEARAEVPLTIPVSRLRWAVSGLDESKALAWHDKPVPIALQDLEDAQDVRLLVRGDFGQPVAYVLSLEGADQSESFELRNGNGGARLSSFLDSLRESGRSRNEFSLTFSLPDEDSSRQLCPVRVDTTWLVEDLEIIQAFTPDKDERRLVFRWRDNGNVKNRAFRLWSLDRQVEEPIEVMVEDSRSEAEFHSSLTDFPHGLYRLELTILDEWAEPSSPALPSPDAGTVFDLDVREDGITLLNSLACRLDVLCRLLKQITKRREVVQDALGVLKRDAKQIATHRSEILKRLFNRLTDTNMDIRQQAVQALEDLGLDVVTQMVERLAYAEEKARYQAVHALGLLATPRAVSALIQCLADKNWRVCSKAVHALVKIGRPAVAPLMDSLTHDDEAVRQQATRVLVELDVDATAQLIVGLTNPDWRVRKQAARALGLLTDPRAVNPLIQCLADSHWAVSQQAAVALGQLGNPKAIPPLRAFLTKNSMPQNVRQAAEQATKELGIPVRQVFAVTWSANKPALKTLGVVPARQTAKQPRAKLEGKSRRRRGRRRKGLY